MKPFRLIRNLLKTNLPKTIWLNFKMLPFKQAVKLPIYIYGKMIFRRMKGQLIIDSEEIHSGMIKIGKRDYYVETTVPQCIWHIEGTLILHGPMKFMQGSYVLVAGGATLEIGAGGTIFGSNFRVFCFDHITIGNNARMAWDVQIMDSSFHYTEDLNREGLVRPLNKPIHIGDNVWVGNRSTIAKGAVLPDYSIVASNSLINKDFSSIESYSLLAGSPAAVKATGIRRIFDAEREKELDKQFGYTRTHL